MEVILALSVLFLLEIDTLPWHTELGGTFWTGLCSQKTKPNWVRPVVFLEYFKPREKIRNKNKEQDVRLVLERDKELTLPEVVLAQSQEDQVRTRAEPEQDRTRRRSRRLRRRATPYWGRVSRARRTSRARRCVLQYIKYIVVNR